MQWDGLFIENAEEVKLSHVGNKSAVIVWKYSSFVDPMRALVSYVGAFEFKYSVTSVNIKTMDIVDHI